LDLMFFLTESPQSPKHVGAVQVFRLPPGAPDTFLRDLVAAYKAAPVAPPFNYHPHFPRFGMPEWREDDDMEMSYHVRHSALPAPGTDAQLMEVIQRLHSGLLDRRRPGWICQVIEGLENDRFAIYTKIHHSYIDGMSGVKRMYGSLSTSPSEKKIVPTWSFQETGKREAAPRQRDSRGDLLGRQARGLMEAAGIFTDISMQWFKLRQRKAQIPYSAAYTRMNRPLEWDTRSTAICTLPLDRVKAVGKAQGSTVNEVVLAVIGAALDDYLERHGERTDSPLVALCPMSLRKEGDDTASTQVSAVHVSLGEPGSGPADRLRQVAESSHQAKEMVSGLSGEAMMDYGVFFFALMELLNRSRLDRYLAPSYNVLVSNVPGPGAEKMYLCGAELEASYPISTLLPGVNLNATVLSHGNSLDFGLMGDMHSLPDLEVVAERMVERFAELERELLGVRSAAKPRKAATRARARAKTGSKAAAKPKNRVRPKTQQKRAATSAARNKPKAKAAGKTRAKAGAVAKGGAKAGSAAAAKAGARSGTRVKARAKAGAVKASPKKPAGARAETAAPARKAARPRSAAKAAGSR
jgi:WS/DGAT/MGAT family acyltransferase